MQAGQWTMDVVTITAVLASVCTLLGYLVANARQARRVSQFTVQREQGAARSSITGKHIWICP